MNGPRLPSGWCWAKVHEVGEVQLGRQRSPEHHTGSHMRPYLRVANVFEDRIDTSDILEMNFTPEEFKRYKLLPGDILLNEGQSRELVGRPAIYRGEVPGACFQNTLIRFRVRSVVIPEFALLVFRSYLRSARFQQIAKWTTSIAHLGVERFANLEFPVPPLAEQRRIVAKFEALLARSRCAKEALDAIPDLLEKFRQSVLAAAFRGDLTADWRVQHPDVEPAAKLLERIRAERRRRWEAAEMEKLRAKGKNPKDDAWKSNFLELEGISSTPTIQLPGGWSWASVGQLLVEPLCNGISVAGSDSPPGIPALKLSAMSPRDFDYNEQRYLPLKWEDVAELEIKPGDFFVSRGNGSLSLVGRGTEAQNPPAGIIFPDTMIRLRFASELRLASWPAMIWSAPAVRQQLEQRVKTTTGIWKIAQTQLASIELPIPPLAEQEEIASRLKRHLQVYDRVGSSLVAALARHGDLESALLSKAFRGELVPQDPNDEPASVLLERIRAERAASAEAASKRTRTARASSRSGKPAGEQRE